MTSKSLPTLLTAVLASLSAQQALASGLQNGQFTQGLSAWQTAGDASVQSGSVLGVNLGPAPALVLGTATTWADDDAPAAAGAFNVSGLDPLAAGEVAGLEALLNLPTSAMGPNHYEGSSALQTFDVQAGQQISFDWRLLTRDNSSHLAEPDTAWLVWNQGNQASLQALGDVANTPMQASTGGWLDSGLHHIAFTSTYTGMVSLGFAVSDTNSFSNTSLLTVQNVSVSAVPEPQSVALALVGLMWLCRSAARMHQYRNKV